MDYLGNLNTSLLDLPSSKTQVVITKLSIPYLITIFVIAIVIHIAIGYAVNKMKKDLSTITPTEEQLNVYKLLRILFIWYPAIAVVIIVLLLYA